MNDLISRSALHETGYEVFEKFVDFPEARRAINQLEQLILSAPAVDAVEVVRCKDCKHFNTEDCAMSFNNDYYSSCWAHNDDFCSYGERRNGDG